MNNQWTAKALKARISNSKKRERFPAGSPNPEEITMYRNYIYAHFQGNLDGKTAVVLGMTPELRSMLHSLKLSVICIDNNPHAIAFFRNWTPQDIEVKETILEGQWRDLFKLLELPVDIIVGDGIFSNILSLDDHLNLLWQIKSVINSQGICVFRKILIPQYFLVESYQPDRLIQKYEAGIIDAAEFGLGMRIFGMKSQAFDEQTFLLDNRESFAIFEQMYQDKIITESAMSAIQRYYFNGLNLITPQAVWEELLKQVGFTFVNTALVGKQWYDYYRVYSCINK